MPTFSIIIPFQAENDYLHETLDHISALSEHDFEVILLPDFEISSENLNKYSFSLTIFPTGMVSPAIKRDQGAKISKGSYLAFIDDDAYPHQDWLKKILPHFENDTIAAVGGPQITPPSDSFWQKVSGATFLSPLNGGTIYRYWPDRKGYYVDDWPSVNLVIRKADFFSVNGFDNSYWPGEDTKLCYDIVKVLKRKIWYEPKAIVYHHRRAGLFKHLKQIGNYGLHRGFFAKKFPQTSFKAFYFIPSLFFLYVVAGWAMLFMGSPLSLGYYLIWTVYVLANIYSVLSVQKKVEDFIISIATVPYVIGTHFWYGWRFLKGFIFIKDLKSILGR